MKTFKIADCVGQILLIVGALIYNFLPRPELSDGFILSYVLIGTWQIISLIAHFFIPGEYKVGLRKIYSGLLLVTAIAVLIGLFSTDLLILMLYALLVWSPAMAILYLTTCLIELRKLKTVET